MPGKNYSASRSETKRATDFPNQELRQTWPKSSEPTLSCSIFYREAMTHEMFMQYLIRFGEDVLPAISEHEVRSKRSAGCLTRL